jgi:hypothetical protein
MTLQPWGSDVKARDGTPARASAAGLRLHFKCLDGVTQGYIFKWLDTGPCHLHLFEALFERLNHAIAISRSLRLSDPLVLPSRVRNDRTISAVAIRNAEPERGFPTGNDCIRMIYGSRGSWLDRPPLPPSNEDRRLVDLVSREDRPLRARAPSATANAAALGLRVCPLFTDDVPSRWFTLSRMLLISRVSSVSTASDSRSPRATRLTNDGSNPSWRATRL